MAFTLQAIQGSDTLTLTSAPYSLLRATGMGGAAARRVSAQGPAQHGDTDLGYRLQPRTLDLVIGIKADTDALLDGYRDDLMSIFKPLTSSPVQLRITRDDGEVRALDCYLRDKIDIALVPGHRPGHYHRVTVPLVAPEPGYYNITQGSVSVVGTAITSNEWWLAGNSIPGTQVKEFGTLPSQGQFWTYTGTSDSSYTIAFRTERLVDSDGRFAFFAGASGSVPSISWATLGTNNYVIARGYTNGSIVLGTHVMGTSLVDSANYFVDYEVYILGGTRTEGHIGKEASGGSEALPTNAVIDVDHALSGTVRRWRSDATNSANSRWTNNLHRYAVYVPGLTVSQINTLDTYMAFGTAASTTQGLSVPYAGDLPEKPIISLRGPITNPEIVNASTGETLDFGTITIGAGTTYVIDTRDGYKTVYAGTVNKRGELTEDSDLGTFHLDVAPLVTGGTNVFLLNGTAFGTATQLTVQYYDRFASY